MDASSPSSSRGMRILWGIALATGALALVFAASVGLLKSLAPLRSADDVFFGAAAICGLVLIAFVVAGWACRKILLQWSAWLASAVDNPQQAAPTVAVPGVTAGFARGRAALVAQVQRQNEAWENIEELVAERTKHLQELIDQKTVNEQRTRHLEAHLREVIRSAGEAIVTLNAQGVVQSFNPTAESLFLYKERDILGRPGDMLIPRASWDWGDSLFCGASIDQLDSPQLYGRQRNGTLFPIEVSVSEFHTGERVFFTWIVRDISDRLEGQRALARSEQRFRALYENALDAVLLLDRHHLLDCNQATVSMFGVENRSAFLNTVLTDLMPPQQANGVDSADQFKELLDFASQYRSVRTEWVWLRHNGESFASDMSVALVQTQPELLIEIAIRDISDAKRIERELLLHRNHLQELVEEQTRDLRKAKEAAEAANRSKSHFLANMSHELRTPLHAILSYADYGLAKLDLKALDRLEKYFANIKTSGERLLLLINDLLDLARLETGKMPYQFQSVNLARIVHQTAQELTPLYQQRDQTLQLPVLDKPVSVWGDPQRLAQVVHNLLTNAHKYTPAGGKIQVELSAAQLEGRPAVVLQVKDSGVGIPSDELESIFDKFNQSSRTRTNAGGTGLGLAICREIMNDHKGLIQACNRPEGGACFTVFLRCEAVAGSSHG